MLSWNFTKDSVRPLVFPFGFLGKIETKSILNIKSKCYISLVLFRSWCKTTLNRYGTKNQLNWNKSNRTTMHPLGIYVIGISIYILNMIHFMMISGDFGVFSLMLTDGPTDGRTDGHTDIQTDRPSYRDARTHLKSLITRVALIDSRQV